MATSISAGSGLRTCFLGSWGNSVVGEDYGQLVRSVPLPSQARIARPLRSSPMMKNVNEGKGLFAPIVVLTREVVGKKRFNQLRGKAIALHSQVITEFCKSIGADAKQRQGLIRLAKKNGELLGAQQQLTSQTTQEVIPVQLHWQRFLSIRKEKVPIL
ncbi:hypothetical protein V2J09_013452 [Rumex salicifolius]